MLTKGQQTRTIPHLHHRLQKRNRNQSRNLWKWTLWSSLQPIHTIWLRSQIRIQELRPLNLLRKGRYQNHLQSRFKLRLHCLEKHSQRKAQSKRVSRTIQGFRQNRKRKLCFCLPRWKAWRQKQVRSKSLLKINCLLWIKRKGVSHQRNINYETSHPPKQYEALWSLRIWKLAWHRFSNFWVEEVFMIK